MFKRSFRSSPIKKYQVKGEPLLYFLCSVKLVLLWQMLRLIVVKCWLQIQVILETIMINFATDHTSTIEEAGLRNLEEFCLEWVEGCCCMFQTEGDSFPVSPQCCSQETLGLYVSELSEQLLLRVSKVTAVQKLQLFNYQ